MLRPHDISNESMTLDSFKCRGVGMATFFYEMNGESRGPINSDELVSLAKRGKIS
jgi:hypothetical protein